MKASQRNENSPLILLDDNHSPWHTWGDHQRQEPLAYVRGYATSGQQFLANETLARHIHQLAMGGRQTIEAEVPKLNGSWAVVVQWPTGEVLAAVDRMRTVPLFFYHDRDCFAIAASAAQLAERFSRPMERRCQIEFLLFRYVTGSETIYEGVQQLQCGEMIHYRPADERRCWATRYFRFYPPTTATEGADALSDELAATILRMFERFRDGFRGKRVVVPLSGGLDSRLVAGMLKRVGVEDCLCFSYQFGDESAEEAEIARHTAESLGFPWRLFTYSPQAWAPWIGSGTLREFIRYGCKGVSQPNLHDFLAVMQLAREGWHGDETVYFPGHTGDMISGGHIPSDYLDLLTGKLNPTDHILRSHGRAGWDDPSPILEAAGAQAVREKTRALASPPPGAAFANPVACCDMWNAEQRQAKYIINSVRTYEFVGAQWATLWDYELMDFFLRVPNELRYGKRLYLDCLRKRIFVDDLAELGEIPIAKHGSLKSLSTMRRPARRMSTLMKWMEMMKRRARQQLLRAGIARRRLTKGDINQFLSVLLASLGIPDQTISFKEALDRLGAFDSLSPEIQQALKPRLGFKLESLRLAGVYGTLALAEMSKGVASNESENGDIN